MQMEKFWIGTEPDPSDRTIIEVSDADAALIKNLPSGPSDAMAAVTDTKGERQVTVRRASCGLRCFCALEFCEER